MKPIDKARQSRLGLSGYVPVLAAMPASIPQLVQKLGRHTSGVSASVREMRQLGIVGCVGVDRSTLRGVAPVWAVGEWPRERLASSPRPHAIAFASIVHAMRERPRSITDLVDVTGLNAASIRKVVAAMRACGMSHIGAYRARHGKPVELHSFGAGADAEPPPRMPKAMINARFRARRAAQRRRLERIAAIPSSVFALGAMA